MPIYEYRCRKCGHGFEELVGAGCDEAGVKCPKCRAGRPEKLISAFGFKSTGADGTTSVSSMGGG